MVSRSIPPPRRLLPLLAAALAGALFAFALGCNEEIDMTRPEVARRTLGEEIYTQLERDLARTPTNHVAKTAALRALRDDFVWAIDTLMPAGEIDAFDELTRRLLPIIDDDRLPDLIRKLAFLYDDLLASPEVLASWERDHRLRVGLSHASAESALIERVLRFPRLRELTDFTVDLILAHDGLGPDGRPAPAENDFLARLLRSVRDQLSEPADPADLHRNVAVVTELALQTDPRFALDVRAQPMWGVRPDPRGLPMVARDERTALLPTLFVDSDGDRWPDADAEGAFLSRQGRPFFIEPYTPPYVATPIEGVMLGRDQLGRAFLPNGDYLYEYVDLNETPLGYLLRRTPELVERGILNDTFIGLEGLLGEPVRTGEYPRFTTSNALLDLLDALFQVGELAGLPALLEGVSLLLTDNEQELADLVVVLDANGDISARHGASLEPDNAFLDDLLTYVWELAQHKGLLDDLLTALQDPMMDRLVIALADLQYYSTPAIRPPLDGPYNVSARSCLRSFEVGTPERFDCLRASNLDEILEGVVDHSRSELDDNVSLQQRLLHLIYDGTGVPYHMQIEQLEILGLDFTSLATDIGPLLTIPDVTAAFFDSIAGNLCLRDHINVEAIESNGLLGGLLELASLLGLSSGSTADTITSIVVFLSDELGVHLDACPSPDQLIRFFNLQSYELDFLGSYARLADPVDREGYLFKWHHADSLYAAEALGLVDGLRPLLQPISDRGLSELLALMLSAVYRHYPEPDVVYLHLDRTPTDFVYSGLRRYEPAMIEIFDDGRMLDVLQRLLGGVQRKALSGGEHPGDVLEELVRHLLDPDAGVMGRNGQTLYVRGDGAPTPMTRFYLLADAIDGLDASLAGQPEARAAWDRASSELVDLLFAVEELPDGTGRFVDRGSPALGAVLTAHLARHLRRHLEGGELFRRLRQDYPAYVEDLVGSRALAAVVELIQAVRSNPADQALFDDFLVYMTEASELTTRSGLALLYQLLLDTTDGFGYVQVAPFYAHLLDPDRHFPVSATAELPLLTHVATVLREMLAADPDDIGIALIRRGLIRPEGAVESPMAVLARVIREVHRLQPGAGGPMSTADMAHLYRTLGAFIRDDFRGLERVMQHMQGRHSLTQPRTTAP
jgi:hypothetical protein